MSTAILPAIVTHQQLGELIAVLRDQDQRRDVILISPERGKIGDASFVADLHVGPIALAEVARCFDHDPAVIRIIDEAQFEQLLVTISQAYGTADVVMTLSSRSDHPVTFAAMPCTKLTPHIARLTGANTHSSSGRPS